MRLEAVIAGSAARGVAGENILARALNQLPPDLLELNVPFGSKVVEYALRLPGGRYVPIDSKWTSLGPLEQLQDVTDASERRRLCERVARDVRVRIREMEKYLDPERTLGLGLLAVPDAVHAAAPEVRGEGYREGVLVVPYSLALPFVLAVYQLALRFGAGAGDEPLAAGVRRLEQALVKLDEEVEGRLSRGLAQVAHAREALREQIGVARRTGASVLRPDEAERPVSAGATQPEVSAE
jgi:DNA recombination protein RmuC